MFDLSQETLWWTRLLLNISEVTTLVCWKITVRQGLAATWSHEDMVILVAIIDISKERGHNGAKVTSNAD